MVEVVVSSESPQLNGIILHMIVEKISAPTPSTSPSTSPPTSPTTPRLTFPTFPSPTFICKERWWYINGDKVVLDVSNLSELRDELDLFYHLTAVGPAELKIVGTGFQHSDLYSLIYNLPLPENMQFIRYQTCLCGIKNCDTVTRITVHPKASIYGQLFSLLGVPDHELSIRFWYQAYNSCQQIHILDTELEDCYSSCTSSDVIPNNIELDPNCTYLYHYYYFLNVKPNPNEIYFDN